MTFLTIEDINTAIYNGVDGFLHETLIGGVGDNDFTNIHFDFCKVSRTESSGSYTFVIEVINSYWNGEYYFKTTDGTYINSDASWGNSKVTFTTSFKEVVFVTYINLLNTSFSFVRITRHPLPFNIENKNTLKDIEKFLPRGHRYIDLINNITDVTNLKLHKGLFTWNAGPMTFYYWGTLLKTDFQFQCTQTVTLSQVNTVQLGADSDYLPNGALVGEYTPNITVIYENRVLDVTYDNVLNDYVFDLDLTDKTDVRMVKFKVLVEVNTVLNQTETTIKLNTVPQTITTQGELRALFRNGGLGILGTNITLTADIDTIRKDTYLKGDNKTINLNGHKIAIPTGRTVRIENTNFTNGENSIQQNTGSKVNLTNCTFTDCTGLGSVIDCQVNIGSLDNPTDFTTVLKDCTFTNNDLCVLHGGELTVENCTVTGKVGDPNYPYFLYQTDGEAELLQNHFNIANNTISETDLQFNPCIFTCGINAEINGLSHQELQQNNITDFLTSPINNTSEIDLSYYYDLIEDYITLVSENGYCHSVSGEDYIFKTNITITRE